MNELEKAYEWVKAEIEKLKGGILEELQAHHARLVDLEAGVKALEAKVTSLFEGTHIKEPANAAVDAEEINVGN